MIHLLAYIDKKDIISEYIESINR